MIEKIAKQYARKYHKGQFRRSSELPYIVHPGNVINYMKQFRGDDRLHWLLHG